MGNALWHTLPPEKIFTKLKTTEIGLSQPQVLERIKKYGLNKLPEEKMTPALVVLLNQFKSPLVYVLLGAAIISFFLLDFVDAGIILVAVIINTILGFYQEYKANKAITYLKKLIDLKAKVLRQSQEIEISANQLVPGDIIFLAPGDKIPADCRLIKVDNLQTIEATLTGESAPLEKSLKILDQGTPLAERRNMVYSGTVVVKGKARGVVCATGINTELGRITQLVKETKEEKTPLQNQLEIFSRNLTILILLICFLIIIFGKLQGRPIFGFGEGAREGMLNLAAAVAVAAIPEGLLISVTAILAIGMQNILKQKALVRKLIATETLGSVSIICTDKTGTLTEGKMQVAKIITAGQELSTQDSIRYKDTDQLKDHDLILKISLLCSDAVLENPEAELENWRIIGDPTESALLLAAIESGIPYEKLLKEQPRLAEIPFDSETKYMVTLNRLDDRKNVIYIKGAPEKIIAMSKEIRINGKKEKLTEKQIKKIQTDYETLSHQGLRLLAFAYKQISADREVKLSDELNDLTFIGFIGLKDPLRPEAKETIKLAQSAGIRTIIVTGDHKLTAQAIVNELGIKAEEKNIIEGKELDKISDEELLKRVETIDIYARVEPKHKIRVINAWQKKGEIVAMTGDGINDAPALKAADVGVALGSGTDVAKETADLILLDNNFKTIIAAVRQGRTIFENIKKVILYLLSDAFGEIILITGSLIFGLPLPVLAAQIIWVNLIDDGLPNLALTFEPEEKEVMNEKPRKKKTKIIDLEMKILITTIAAFVNLILLGIFYYLVQKGYPIDYIRTIIFTNLGVSTLIYVFSCRSLRHSIITKNPFSNKYLLVAVLIGFILQFAAVYQPQLQRIFKTVDLTGQDWLLVLGVALIQMLFIEIIKFYFIIKGKKIKSTQALIA